MTFFQKKRREEKSLSLNGDGRRGSGINGLQTEPPEGPLFVCAVIRPEEAVGERRLAAAHTYTTAHNNLLYHFSFFFFFFFFWGEEEGQFELSCRVLGLFKPAFD